MKKVASLSELSNAPTHKTIGQIEMIIDKFWVFYAKKPKIRKKTQASFKKLIFLPPSVKMMVPHTPTMLSNT